MIATFDQLQPVAPRMPSELFSCLLAAMAEFQIDSDLRQAAFLAQTLFESNQYTQLVEASDGKAYDPPGKIAQRLGNTGIGDGPKYIGRGAIQITGRTNYTRASDALGVDLVSQPELAATPELAFRVAGWYWNDHELSPLADAKDFERITREINGGLNGLEFRLHYYNKLLAVLGCEP